MSYGGGCREFGVAVMIGMKGRGEGLGGGVVGGWGRELLGSFLFELFVLSFFVLSSKFYGQDEKSRRGGSLGGNGSFHLVLCNGESSGKGIVI